MTKNHTSLDKMLRIQCSATSSSLPTTQQQQQQQQQSQTQQQCISAILRTDLTRTTDMLPRIPEFVGPIRLSVFLAESLGLSPEILRALPPPAKAAFFIYVRKADADDTSVMRAPTVTGSFANGFKKIEPLAPAELVSLTGVQSRLATNILTSSSQFFSCLFAVLPTACITFLRAHCAIVAQFEPDGGGVHVLGTSLQPSVTRENYSLGIPRDAARISHYRRFGRPWVSGTKKTARSENGSSSASQLKRRRVERPADQGILLSPKLLLSHGAQVKELTWLSQRGIDAFRLILQRHASSATETIVGAASSLFSHVWLRRPDAQSETQLQLKEQSTNGIVQLLSVVSFVAARVNVRGAALKLQSVRQYQQQLQSDSNIRIHAAAVAISPEHVAHIFFNTALRELSRRVCRILAEQSHPCIDATFEPEMPRDAAEVWLFGGSDNLQHLLDSLVTWLSCTSRGLGVKPAVLLRSVRLSSVPWLCCIEQGGRHRSARLQQTFGVFWAWMLTFVLPEWARQALHVTYSPRHSGLLLFYLKDEWNAWLRRALSADSTAAAEGERCIISLANNGAPPHLTQVVTRNRVRRVHAASSPLSSRAVLYSAVRLLPDGAKLRPISVIRSASARALGRLAVHVPHNKSMSVAQANAAGMTTTEAAAVRAVVGKVFDSRSPNQLVLRRALQCLYCGLREKRLSVSPLHGGCSSGLGMTLNRTHADDYALLIDFARQVVTVAQKSDNESNSSNVVTRVSFVKADASRCFDMLDQSAVETLINELVSHTRYHVATCDMICPRQVRNKKNNNNCNNNNNPSQEDHGLGIKRWSTTLNGTDFAAGFVPAVPSHTIVEPLQHGIDTIDGAWVRAALHHHTQNHLRVVRGRLYEQSNAGIAQGSTVASVLCDACLTAVDSEVAEVLEQFQEDAVSLTLRRMDDLLVLSTSRIAAEVCADRIVEGWPKIGFVCNKQKLCTSFSVGASLTNVSVAPWCGVLLHCGGSLNNNSSPLEVSVDWSRISSAALAASSMLQPQSDSGLLIGFFRAIRSVQMRFVSPGLVCTELNSRSRIFENLLEAFSFLASTLCKMLALQLVSARPHPRVFFRTRAVAESSLRHHVEWQLAPKVAAAGSRVPADIAEMCKFASLRAFSRTIVEELRQPHGREDGTFQRMQIAARIATGVFARMGNKRFEL